MKVYLISPPSAPFIPTLSRLLPVGITRFQYRRPELTDRERYQELNQVQTVLTGYSTKLFVNNRPDLADLVDADGTHLGQDDIRPKTVNNHWPDLTIGATVRPGADIPPSADYAGVGPVFKPGSKQLDIGPTGWEGVVEVVSATEKPCWAIGGMTPKRAKQAPDELQGVAVISGIWEASSPRKSLEKFKTM